MIGVVGDPHSHAALGRLAQRGRDHVARFAGQPDVVEREVERLARLAQERGHALGEIECALAVRVERIRLDHAKRKPVAAGSSSIGLSGIPSGSSGLLKPRGATSFGVSGWNSAARYWMWSRPTPSSDWPPP